MSYNLTGFTINNFRVFGNETHFELAPLTILTGTNSSGKSSFTKALHLLYNSYKSNGLYSLELMESDLKIGPFESIKNLLKKDKQICFGLELKAGRPSIGPKILSVDLVYTSIGLQSVKVFSESELVLESAWDFYGVSRIINKSYIKLPDKIICTDELRKSFVDLSQTEFELICKSILDYLETNIKAHSFQDGFYNVNDLKLKYDQLEGNFIRIKDGLEVIGELLSLGEKYFYDEETSENIPYNDEIVFSANPYLKDILPKSILEITDDSILNQYLAKFLNLEILKEFEIFPSSFLENFFNRLIFIDGVRATQEMVYTKDNSPSFYKVLSEVYLSRHLDYSDLKKWVVDEFKLIQLEKDQKIEDVISVNQITGFGYILEIKQKGKDIGLEGLGYGVAQLLPIILKVSLSHNAIFIIEEPESNLHPALQSKLADFFVSKFKRPNSLTETNFIIETHSEYLIRKLQYLTAKGKIAPDQTQIYYFNHPDNKDADEEQVKKININEDGSLTDNFGRGFFDEADNIALELFLLNQSQKN